MYLAIGRTEKSICSDKQLTDIIGGGNVPSCTVQNLAGVLHQSTEFSVAEQEDLVQTVPRAASSKRAASPKCTSAWLVGKRQMRTLHSFLWIPVKPKAFPRERGH